MSFPDAGERRGEGGRRWRRRATESRVAIEEIGEEAEKADGAGEEQSPPGPLFTASQREGDEPEVERSDGDEGAPEGDSVVEDEVDDAALMQVAELARLHAKERDVVGEKLTGD